MAESWGTGATRRTCSGTWDFCTKTRGDPTRPDASTSRRCPSLRSLDIARAELFGLSNLGDLSRKQGQVDEARDLFNRALTAARRVGDRAHEGVVLGRMASLLVLATGNTREAVKLASGKENGVYAKWVEDGNLVRWWESTDTSSSPGAESAMDNLELVRSPRRGARHQR